MKFLKSACIYSALIVSAAVVSCKAPQAAKKSYVADKGPEFLLEKLSKNEFDYEWLTGKISAEVIMDGQSNSLKASIRLKKDSAIWILINPLGIEMARVLISKDSVKFMNKMNKTFFEGDFNYLSKLADTEIDFNTLQSLLIGNATEEFKSPNFKIYVDRPNYLLSTIKKRVLRRSLNKQEKIERLEKRDRLEKVEKIEQHEVQQLKEVLQDTANLEVRSIWLNPVNNKVSRFRFHDIDQGRILEVNYSDFIQIDSLLFPKKINIEINSDRKINVAIEYSKVTHSEPLVFPFKVPENYDRIR